jgi:hypothetical protein
MEFFDVCSCRSLEIPFDLACCSLDTEAASHFPALPEIDFQREFTNIDLLFLE